MIIVLSENLLRIGEFTAEIQKILDEYRENIDE